MAVKNTAVIAQGTVLVDPVKNTSATIVVCWLESPATLGVFVVAAAAAVDEEDAMIRTQPNIKAVDGSYCCDAQRE